MYKYITAVYDTGGLVRLPQTDVQINSEGRVGSPMLNIAG